ncbi:MAG: hypothetical protein D6796_09090, partial [Caldilineae bacterium]
SPISNLQSPPAAELPEWMEELPEEAESPISNLQSPPAAELPPEVEVAAEAPDWLAELEAEGEGAEEQGGRGAEEMEAESPISNLQSPPAAELPEWMEELPEEAESPISSLQSPPTELPEWMEDLSAAEEEEEEIAAAEAPEEIPPLPPWMEEILESDIEPAEAVGIEPETAEPDWALPEAPPPILSPEEETPPLPAEILGEVGDVLSVPTGMQPPGATGAEALIGIEAARRFHTIVHPPLEMPVVEEPKPVAETALAQMVRASLNLLFLLLLIVPLFIHYDRGGYPFPWLEPSPAEQEAIRTELQTAIGALPPEAVALVSFDYTPATEGEMSPLAQAVVQKLLGQGLRVLAVSLEPEGQAMAQTVLTTVLEPEAYGKRVLNLGYLPGGPIAVRNLAFEAPLDAARDVETGQPYRALTGWPAIARITDVGLVVEITDHPDTARWWAEQLQSPAGRPAVPKLAVVSAAAEPFVRPYRESGQFTALVAGINGAAALESSRPQKTLGPATAMLDSQSVAHLVVMILMLFGTIAGLIARYGQESD